MIQYKHLILLFLFIFYSCSSMYEVVKINTYPNNVIIYLKKDKEIYLINPPSLNALKDYSIDNDSIIKLEVGGKYKLKLRKKPNFKVGMFNSGQNDFYEEIEIIDGMKANTDYRVNEIIDMYYFPKYVNKRYSPVQPITYDSLKIKNSDF